MKLFFGMCIVLAAAHQIDQHFIAMPRDLGLSIVAAIVGGMVFGMGLAD
ncbi:hypothetical protein vBRpoSV10_186 [Ruegeria phage vB_RpoS-V10]|nr:hypothetical protein vBRpoSV10_186 [Ruegeria phage vB_RpoS-V10]